MPGYFRLAPFRQTDVMAPLGARSHAASHGACHNFTIDWLQMMFHNDAVDTVTKAPSQKRMRELAKGLGGGNPVLQAAFSRRWKEGDHRVADEMMIKIRGLKERGMPIPFAPVDWNFLKDTMVTAPQYEGFIYSFWFVGSVVGATGGAHTIGFYRKLSIGRGKLSKDTAYTICYDPNFGEIYVPDAEFLNWFGWLSNTAYGPFSSHFCKAVSMK